MKERPDLPKMMLKKGVLKAVERGIIKQVKGKGFSGSFKVNILYPAMINYLVDLFQLDTPKNLAKAKAKEAASAGRPPLESVFPLIFTWATNPKESSVTLIKKYIAKVILHHVILISQNVAL